jgi:hypothetical protein
MTDGEIVRMRSTLALTPGAADGTSMTVTLPSGLTYSNDGTVTVLLVSPNGDTSTTLTGTGLQLAEGGTPVNTAKLDLGTGGDTTDPVVASVPSGAITYNSSTNTITFNLGNLGNGETGAPMYAIVEFNTIVGSAVAGGSVLSTSMTGTANGTTSSSVTDYVDTETPTVTLAKQVEGISYNPDGSATVTYLDTVTDTGGAPAYGLSLTDPGAGTGTVTDPHTHAGNSVGASSSASGSGFNATLTSLPTGGSETFTYTVNIPSSQIPTAVADSGINATVTWSALNPTQEVGGKEVLAGTSLTPSTYSRTAEAGLGLASGTVNQDLGTNEGTNSPLQPLSGQIVTVTFNGQVGTETVSTDSKGNFSALIPTSGAPVSITVTPSGTTALATSVLDNHPDAASSLTGTGASTTGTNPATLTFTPTAGTGYTGLTFDFWATPAPYVPQAAPPAAAPVVPELPLIPQLALIGSVENRFIIEDQETVIQVPSDIFVDSDPNAELAYDAKLPDGTPLPSWLSFNASDLTFSGTPPLTAHGRLEITITARDQYGNTAEASFSILIGRKQEDLTKLLSQTGSQDGEFRPYGFQLSAASPIVPPGSEQAIQLAEAAPVRHHDASHIAQTWRAVPATTRPGEFGGFSAALRGASQFGVLARARALLDGLNGLPQTRPPV